MTLDELHKALAEALHGHNSETSGRDCPVCLQDADHLLPAATAYAEQRARARAAEELEAAAAVHWADRVSWAEVRLDLRRRAAALDAQATCSQAPHPGVEFYGRDGGCAECGYRPKDQP